MTNVPDNDERRWHALSAEDVLDELRTGREQGLPATEVEQRREQYGANRLTPHSERSTLRRLVSQFNNLFIYLLLAAGTVTAALGEWLDSGVIGGVVLVIVIIGFVQEGRAARSLEAVQDLLAPKARVLRDGKSKDIPAEEVVVGDIVLLHAGDRVPADLRLVETKNLQAQEAALTGESAAVEKNSEPVAEDAELGDRTSMSFSGTVITAGEGTGVSVAVGDGSEIGRISGMLANVEDIKTPLMQRVDSFAKVLSIAILGLAALTFAAGTILWSRDWDEMFFAAVAIAVAAVPEGLPAVMTVTLALGVQRMAGRNAIIRRLPAVETLGSVTIICSDKTGTLTRNEMTVKTVRTAQDDIEVEGVGYEPEGQFRIDENEIDLADYPVASGLIRAGMLCNDASVDQDGDEWKPEGDPTEAALIVLARKAAYEPESEAQEWSRIDAIPFASERRYMATLNRSGGDEHTIYVKGAPERVLEMCAHEQRGDETVDLAFEDWEQRIDAIAERGQRVLAVARKVLDSSLGTLDEDEAERGLTLLGLVGLIDPPRDEAIEAVAVCQRAGIRVKMITGDHALTAQAIAKALGLDNPDEVLTGRELEDIGDEELRRKAIEVDVFARASPEHKLRLVEALQAEHHVTAMTGDGVNDAPALKRADIGIAMGQKGTDAAREASAMVLADDNFASIERAVEEGRTVYDNLKKAILFLLPTSAAEALIIAIAIMVGLELPITPVQILWINMITAATLGMALAWERAEDDIMRRLPRPTDERLLTGFMLWRIGFVGLLLIVGAGLLFLREQANDDTSLAFARTVAVNALVLGEIFYLWNVRYLYAPAFTRGGLLGSRAVLIAVGICFGLQVGFTHLPFMNTLFGTEPLDAEAWLWCVAAGLLVFVAVEFEKLVLRRRGRRAGATASAADDNDSQTVERRPSNRESTANNEKKQRKLEEESR